MDSSRKPESVKSNSNLQVSINALPDELILLILSYLNARELASKSTVCKQWNNLVHDSTLWKEVSFTRRNACLESIIKVLNKHKNLEKIHVVHQDMMPILMAIENKDNVKYLGFEDCSCVGPGLDILVSTRCIWKNLNELVLHTKSFTEQYFESLLKLIKSIPIRHLSVGKFCADTLDIEELCIQNLETLVAKGVYYPSENSYYETMSDNLKLQKGLNLIKNSIKNLELDMPIYGGESLKRLSECQNLVKLSVCGEFIEFANVCFLCKLNHLNDFCITNTSILSEQWLMFFEIAKFNYCLQYLAIEKAPSFYPNHVKRIWDICVRLENFSWSPQV